MSDFLSSIGKFFVGDTEKHVSEVFRGLEETLP